MKYLFVLMLFLLSSYANCAETYRISLIRAVPGHLESLINETKAMRKKENGNLIIMRHSQGDHWDLMLLDVVQNELPKDISFRSAIAFQDSFLATADWSWKYIKNKAQENGLYHIEMFHALSGKKEELHHQREMENRYYQATEREGNVIFTTFFGSDVDSFTLGFYPTLKVFATDPDLADEVFEKAATDAGFKSRASIGFYLRSLISSHHDTLATRVE